MSDITKCTGIDCPLKSQCKRFTIEPHKFRQAYFLEPPFYNDEDGWHCEMYWGDNAEAVWKDLNDIMGISLPE